MKEGVISFDAPVQDAGYEKKDVNLKLVALVAFLILALLTTFLVVLDQYFVLEKEEIISEQVLQKDSPQLLELRRQEQEILTTYKLVDSQTGVYRIPVSRAMELMVAENSTESQSE